MHAKNCTLALTLAAGRIFCRRDKGVGGRALERQQPVGGRAPRVGEAVNGRAACLLCNSEDALEPLGAAVDGRNAASDRAAG